MKYVRLAGAVLVLIPFVPAYLMAGCWESLRTGWRTGRAEVRRMLEE